MGRNEEDEAEKIVQAVKEEIEAPLLAEISALKEKLAEKSAIRCPNCERLRKALKSAFHREYCPKKNHGLCQRCIDGIIKMEDALALPSEEKKCWHDWMKNPKAENHLICRKCGFDFDCNLEPSESGGKCENDEEVIELLKDCRSIFISYADKPETVKRINKALESLGVSK